MSTALHSPVSTAATAAVPSAASETVKPDAFERAAHEQPRARIVVDDEDVDRYRPPACGIRPPSELSSASSSESATVRCARSFVIELGMSLRSPLRAECSICRAMAATFVAPRFALELFNVCAARAMASASLAFMPLSMSASNCEESSRYSAINRASRRSCAVRIELAHRLDRRVIERDLVGRRARDLRRQQDVAQLREREGLREIVVHAGREAGFAIAGERVRGERDHARRLLLLDELALAQLARRDEAVHDRHLAVHEHHVEILFFERVERFDAIAGVHRVAAETLQHLERQRAVDHVVLDEQDREVIEHGFVLRCEHGGRGTDFVERHGLQRFVQGAAQHALAHGLREPAHRRELRHERGFDVVRDRAHHDRGDLSKSGLRRTPNNQSTPFCSGMCQSSTMIAGSVPRLLHRVEVRLRFAGARRRRDDEAPGFELRSQDLDVDRAVVDDQHARAGREHRGPAKNPK